MQKYGVDNFNKVAIIGSGNKTLDSYSATIGIPNKRFGDTPLDHALPYGDACYQTSLPTTMILHTTVVVLLTGMSERR